MAKGLVVYYSRSGNTEKMAEIIAEAMNEAKLPKAVSNVKTDDLLAADAIVVGSPACFKMKLLASACWCNADGNNPRAGDG